MNQISLEQARDAIRQYWNKKCENRPYFVLVDDDETYREIVDFVGGNRIHTSDYCRLDDSFPDMDGLKSSLEAAPAGSKNILLGFGEALNLRFNPNNGSDKERNLRDILKDNFNIPGKLVVVCRFLYSEIQEFTRTDKKFTSDRYCYIPPAREAASCKITQTSIELNYPTLNGFKELLRKLEQGDSDNKKLYVRSCLYLHNVTKIDSAFEALKIEDSHFNGERIWLTDQQWEKYRENKNLSNRNAIHWRTFLDLKLNGASDPNKEYKEYVVNHSSTYSEYKNKVFNALLDFSPSSDDFIKMYNQRKYWIKDVEESYLSAFISSDLIGKSDQFQVYYLTDNSSVERQTILKWLSKNELTPKVRNALKWIYPDLDWYLGYYHFNNVPNGVSNDDLDDYFQQYRLQKVANKISEKFQERVNQYSLTRPYNYFPTRGEVLERLPLEQDKTFLYWLDAMGVEYLPFIQNWAKEHELNMTTRVGRTILPTITSMNRGFYDDWHDNKKANGELDDIKHEGVPGVKEAQYLEKELEVIKSALNEIYLLLSQEGIPINKVVLVSDHGASRLAVVGGQEVGCKMREKGKYSGRCCPVNELDDNPPDCVTREGNFWMFANYQRFGGGRKADVEVHGGATLEEVIVPVIAFSLKSPKMVLVKGSSTIKIKSDKSAVLYLACAKPLENAWVKWNDKSYPVERQDDTTYCVTFQNVNVKADTYEADVWENDTALNSITFTLEKGFGKTSGISEMFD